MSKKSKTTARDFEIFKREFTKYQKLLGLTGIQVRFSHVDLDGSFAVIIKDYGEYIATVKLNKTVPPEQAHHVTVRLCAKHEAIHLLLMRLEGEGKYRYATEESIDEAAEETVHRLENVIP